MDRRLMGARMDAAWLGEPSCADRALVGGEAAVLGRLAATHRVLPGFF